MEETNIHRVGRSLVRPMQYLLLSIGGIVMAFPYFWMMSTSLKVPGTWFNLSLIPEQISFQHYQLLLTESLLPRWYLNTIIIAAIGTVSAVFSSSLTGYALARYNFPGRDLIFVMILATLMIPSQMLVIPWYVNAARLGWTDTIQGVLMPGLASTFGVFLMRQFMSEIPNELLDAGRIDGVSEFGLFRRICFPLAKPAVAVVFIFTFLGHWNSFMWPLIVLNSSEKLTLEVGLARLSLLETGPDWGATLSGAAIASLPMLIVFAFFQQQIVRGITITGLKG